MNNKPININITWQSVAVIISMIGGIWLVYLLLDVLALLFFSGIMAVALNPLVANITKKVKSRTMAILLVMLLFVGIIGLAIALLVPTVIDQIQNLDSELPALRDQLFSSISSSTTLTEITNDIFDGISGGSDNLISSVTEVTKTILTGLFAFITVLVLTTYILFGGKSIIKSLIGFLPTDQLQNFVSTTAIKVSIKLGDWLRGQLIASVFLFTLIYIGLRIIGVDNSLTLALIAAITDFVPFVGGFIGVVPAVLIAFTTSGQQVVLVLVLYLVAQQIQGHFVLPQVLNRTLGLPPVVIIIAVLIAGKLFGIFGIFVAAPVSAAILVIIEEARIYFSDKIT